MKILLFVAGFLYLWFMVVFVPGKAWGLSPEAWGLAWIIPLVLLVCLIGGMAAVARS